MLAAKFANLALKESDERVAVGKAHMVIGA